MVSIIDRAVEHNRQAILPLLLASLPWLIAGVVGGFSTPALFPFVLLLLNITWTLTLVGNTSYWLLVPPIMAIRMLSCRDMALRWNDPAHTEGIRTFSEGYAFPALFLALGALAVTVPGLVDRSLFGTYLLYLYGWLLILALWVGVLTQLCIYTIIRRFKLSILDVLAAQEGYMIPESRTAEFLALVEGRPDLTDSLALYNVVAAAPGLPFGTAVVVPYVAAIVGSVVGILLQ